MKAQIWLMLKLNILYSVCLFEKALVFAIIMLDYNTYWYNRKDQDMKKALVALGMLVATSALADIRVTTALTITDAQGSVRKINDVSIVDEKSSTLTYTHDDGVRYVLTIDSYDDEYAMLNAKIVSVDDSGNDVVLSHPVLKTAWGKEAVIRVGNSDGEGLEFCVIVERV